MRLSTLTRAVLQLSRRGDKMRIKSAAPLVWALTALTLPMVVSMPISAHAQDQATPPASTMPDNSARNKELNQTAENQKENTPDREITQRIRQSIVKDKSLSTYAHNVKIITQDGQVHNRDLFSPNNTV